MSSALAIASTMAPFRRLAIYIRLSAEQFSRRPARLAMLVLAVAVGAAALFAGLLLHEAVAASAAETLDRLGADVLVLPARATCNLTSALLVVEPSEHLIDAEAARRLASLPGVERAAPQRVLLLPSAEGHSDAVFVAFDPGNDLTVMPWVVERASRPFGRGDLIVGGRRPETVGSTVVVFGRALRVWGRLGLAGVGPFERGAFVSFETAADVADATRSATGREAWRPGDARVSAILVRLSARSTVEQLRFAAAGLPEVQLVAGGGVQTAVRRDVAALLRGSLVVSIAASIATMILVALVYSAIIAERRRELGLLLSMGLRPRRLLTFVVIECATTTGVGGVCGALLGSAALLVWQRSIGFALESSSVPLTLPGTLSQLLAGAGAVAISGLLGIVGAFVPAFRASPLILSPRSFNP